MTTKLQELLGKILRNRIEREKSDGTLEADRDNLTQTLDLFVAGNKITAEQYSEFTDLLTPTESTATTDNVTPPASNAS